MQQVLYQLLTWYRQPIESALLEDLILKYSTPSQILEVLGFMYEEVCVFPRSRVCLCFKDEAYLLARITKNMYVAYNGVYRLVSRDVVESFGEYYSILGFHDDFYTRMNRLYLFTNKEIHLASLLMLLALFSEWLILAWIGWMVVYILCVYHRKRKMMASIFNEYEIGMYDAYLNHRCKELFIHLGWMLLLMVSITYDPQGSPMMVLGWLPLQREYVFFFAVFATLYHPFPAMTLLLMKYPYPKAQLPLCLIYRYLNEGQSINELSIHHVTLKSGVYLLTGVATEFSINNISFLNPSFIQYHQDIYYVKDLTLHSEWMDISSFQTYLDAIQRPELVTYALHIEECQGEIAEIMVLFECSLRKERLIYLNVPIVHVSLETLQKIIWYLKTKQSIIVIYMPQHYFVENLDSCDIITPEMR